MKQLLTVCLVFIITASCVTAAPLFVPERVPVTGAEWQQTGEAFSFVILGDKTSGGEGKWPIFDQAVAEINLLRPDFVITTGDQIPGHMEERA